MPLTQLFEEILNSYSIQLSIDNKTSNPYFSGLRRRIQEIFGSIAEQKGLRIKALGGMGIMNTVPYISFLAPGHKTSKGIYPIYHFDCNSKEFWLEFGDSHDADPPESLRAALSARASELLPDFSLRDDDGHLAKKYRIAQLQEQVLQQDLERVLQAYETCLREFHEEISEFLKGPPASALPIPQVDRKAIIDAMEKFDLQFRTTPKWSDWEKTKARKHSHAVEHEGRGYPIKRIISIATGIRLNQFKVGEQANNYLKDLGFQVITLQKELNITSSHLENGAVYTRADLKRKFGIGDASINTGIFRPKGQDSVWLFVTENKTSDRPDYYDWLDGDTLHWEGQTAGRRDHLIIEHRQRGLELLLFYRKDKSEYPGSGFRYEARFQYISHEETKPRRFILQRVLSAIDEKIIPQQSKDAYFVLHVAKDKNAETKRTALESFDALVKAHSVWGLRPNASYRKILKPGDRVLFYLTGGKQQAFVGAATLKSVPYVDQSGESNQWFLGNQILRIDLQDVVLFERPKPRKRVRIAWKPGMGACTRISREDFVTVIESDTGEDVQFSDDELGNAPEDIDVLSIIRSLDLGVSSNFEPHLLRSPDRIKISQIIHNVEKGNWVLPHFQRYFDWKRNDVAQFLESIFKDYYVGALLLWDTDKDPKVAVMPINGVSLAKEQIRPDQIVLDGQQRITSLFYAMKCPDFRLKGSSSRLFFYANLKTFLESGTANEIIESYPKQLEREETFKKLLFPFSELENARDWVDDLEDYLREKGVDDEKARKVRKLIDKRLTHLWNGFEIPYVALPKSIELYQVTEIFERINSKGKRLTVFDLLIARLYNYKVELKKLWDSSLHQHALLKKYSKIEKLSVYILQSMSLLYEKTSSAKTKDVLNIYEKVYATGDRKFENDWIEISGYVSKAIALIENLKDGFGILSSEELPFASMIPVLAALLKEIDGKPLKAECNRKLSIWYWASVFSNAYSSAAETRMTMDFKAMDAWFLKASEMPPQIAAVRHKIPHQAFHQVASQSNSMFKGILALIALQGAIDMETGRTLEHSDKNDKDHIFPASTFSHEPSVNSILNITWMSPETNRRIKHAKKPSVFIKEFIDQKYGGDEKRFAEVLASHLISSAAFKCMLNDDFNGFLTERQKTISSRLAELLEVDLQSPEHSLVSPKLPFTNKFALRETLRSCVGYIHWIDKYFSKPGFDFLADGLDRTRVKEVKILSTAVNLNETCRDLYKDLKKELAHVGISLEMRIIIDKALIVQIHDRWILSESEAFNVPSTDTIARGQYSDINKTTSRPPFNDWWSHAKDILSDWPQILPLITK